MVPRALLLLTLPACASGAGMNTHSMVGHRAWKYYGVVERSPNASRYNAAVASHPSAVLAGADFPDFLYACGSYADHHDAGEYAHWPPFQAAAVKHIRAQPDFGSGNWSEHTQLLVGFVMGVGAHYIADELWEGLNDQLSYGQGFVRTLSSFILGHDGCSDNDESVANMAADFLVSFNMDEHEIRPWERTFPVDDIIAIYRLANWSDVTAAPVRERRVVVVRRRRSPSLVARRRRRSSSVARRHAPFPH